MSQLKNFFAKSKLKASYRIDLSTFEVNTSDFIDDQVFLPFYNKNLQRELVWGQKEKEALIESLMKGLVIPPLVAIRRDGLRGDLLKFHYSQFVYLIDGKQRFNALRGYINNEYQVLGSYFKDLAALTPTDLDGELTGRELQRQIENGLRCIYYSLDIVAHNENYKPFFIDLDAEKFIFTKNLQDDMITLFVKHNHTGVKQDEKSLQEWADIQKTF